MKRLQHTLKKPVSFSGIGLHSGLPVEMTLVPAPANSGITFCRTDLAGRPTIPARPDCVTDTNRATTLSFGEAYVFTVEHVLSALYAMEIDNCTIEMNSPEPPVADGGAKTFVDMILEAGIADEETEADIFTLSQSVAAYEKEKFIAALPYDGLRITYTSINPHPLLGTQVLDITVTPESYQKKIAPARTIGFTWELDALKKMGLGKGGTTENCIVYSTTGCLSKLLWKDELVRHKILDILGDISLIGPLSAHIIAVNGSHKLNGELTEKLLQLKQA